MKLYTLIFGICMLTEIPMFATNAVNCHEYPVVSGKLLCSAFALGTAGFLGYRLYQIFYLPNHISKGSGKPIWYDCSTAQRILYLISGSPSLFHRL
ncbi:MAG TPA: hypothetical protein VGW78_00440 [Candidatus Babeliales bacterium]|jgi:hypothetical protein|nr:hypothetical protein [Candidatus Babeliales bacterium]